MGLAEKAQAQIHQTWLEYGPAVSDLRSANRDVRQCISDMGTELGIADSRDLVGACLGQPELDRPGAWLYPLALVVPGPQHIIDSAMCRGLQALPWWPDWQRSAKVVCQWLRPAIHRDLLVHRLQASGGQPDVVGAHIASLRTSCESFANWRWKTLLRVTKHLARMEQAVIVSTGGLSAMHLSSKDIGLASAFLESVGQPDFWRRVHFLGQLVEPLGALSSWMHGCDCHEHARTLHQRVDCDWAGCRAARLASRIAQTMHALDQLRHAEAASSMAQMSAAASSTMASLDMKMAWLRQTPYTIWQATACAVS